MQDRKALQAGTSHYLGQNFAKGSNIRFLNQAGELEFAHTTSWGVSTRLIGGMVMAHGDDDGIRVPPRVAPKHVVILPVVPKPETQDEVYAYADRLAQTLKGLTYHGVPLRVHVDKRDIRGGEKNWQWVKKGIPLRIEVGPRDVANQQMVVYRRDQAAKEKIFLPEAELAEKALSFLDGIQQSYFQKALDFRAENINTSVSNWNDFKAFFTPKNASKPEIHGGFVKAKWSEDPSSLAQLAELKVTVRCLPLEQSGTAGTCVLTGQPAVTDAIFAKAY